MSWYGTFRNFSPYFFFFLLTYLGWLSSASLLSVAWQGIELLAVCGEIFILDIYNLTSQFLIQNADLRSLSGRDDLHTSAY